MKTLTALIFCLTLCTSLYLVKHEVTNCYLKKPHQTFGSRIIKKGHVFSDQTRSIKYIGSVNRNWPLYCPAIHKRPKNYGQPK